MFFQVHFYRNAGWVQCAFFFFFQAEDGIRDTSVTGVQTCALPIFAGWDFFNNDNDPFDQSSYSSANNHGSGRAEDAAEEGNDGQDGIGVCPHCQILPMRVWDTFVVDTNNYAEAVTYAADNGAKVVEGAVGGLFNSSFARQAFAYAYSKGTLPVLVSSDLNTADHNFPTDYDQSLFVAGTVADTEGAGADLPDCGGGASFCQSPEP